MDIFIEGISMFWKMEKAKEMMHIFIYYGTRVKKNYDAQGWRSSLNLKMMTRLTATPVETGVV